MRNFPWEETADVREISGKLAINGTKVPASKVSISRSIPSHLPAQISGVGGYSAATADAVLISGPMVSEQSPTPWSSTLPRPFDDAEAWVTVNGNDLSLFQGAVDGASGSASSNEVSLKFVDISDRLNRTISMRALCNVMPPITPDGSTNNRNMDLYSTYFVDRVLRECEFYATPEPVAYCVMSAPLQGSMWPNVGRLRSSGREATSALSPWWREAPWGLGLKSATADYEPNLDQWGSVDGSLASRSMEIVLCAGPVQNSSGRVTAEWNTGAALAVTVTSSRSVIAQVRFGANPDGSNKDFQAVVTATAGQLGDWRVVSARFTPRGDGTMGISLKTDSGVEIAPRAATIPYGIDTRPVDNVNLRCSDSTFGGVQVGFPGKAFQASDFMPTAVLTPPVPMNSLRGSPAIKAVPAIDLLKQWSEAECAAMWIDEDGVFHWRNRTAFVSGPVVWRGNSLNDLLELDWSHDIQGATSRVTVEYPEVAVQRSKRRRIVVWEGSGQTMEPGDVMEDIVTASDGEAWIGVDGYPFVFQAETSKTVFNKGEGSWTGYVGYDKDGNENGNGKYVGYASDMSYIGPDTWKIVQTWDGAAPTGVDHIKLQTRDGGTALKPQWQGVNLPIVRAQSKLTFTDVSLTAAVGGLRSAPELEHETKWWLQSSTQARSLAFWLAQQTVKPLPVVEGVEITADPRLQLGDKVTLADTHRTRLQITGVITEISHAVEAGNHTMTLRLLVLTVVASQPTLLEYDQVWAGATLSARDMSWAGTTLGQFDADPLKA